MEKRMRELTKGDYVLATKYRDGDPFDGYAVGFFDSMLPKAGGDRYMVVDGQGKQYRGNGFRRCERISHDLGSWIVAHRTTIEGLTRMKPLNMWRFRRKAAREELEALMADPVVAIYRARIESEAAAIATYLAKHA